MIKMKVSASLGHRNGASNILILTRTALQTSLPTFSNPPSHYQWHLRQMPSTSTWRDGSYLHR